MEKINYTETIDDTKVRSFVDMDLYYKIYCVRKDDFDYAEFYKIKDYPLIGKTIINTVTGKKYIIESAHKEWFAGYTIKLLARDENDSHAVIFWENINCVEDMYIDEIELNKRKYKIL